MTVTSPEDIRAQLERVLASPEFAAGKRLAQFLRFVVERSHNGDSSSIKQHTIAAEALGYGHDFDPGTNPTVRIVARRVRRALDRYYLDYGVSDPIRIEIRKGSYKPVIRANPTATAEPAPSAGPSLQSAPKQTGDSHPSIAVIEFDCLNARDQTEYVATGVSEEILIALTRFPEFNVVGPLSSQLVRDEGLDSRGVGDKYGVRFVLNGSLRSFGRELRITARLADAANGRQLWGQSLNCALGDNSLMECEHTVVSRIVAAIADAYGVIPRTLTAEALDRKTAATGSYDAILHFNHHMRVLTEASHTDAQQSLERAVQQDPNNAQAMGMLSDLWASAYLEGFADEPAREQAEELAWKAMALDPNCQQVRYAMALVYLMRFQRDSFMAEAERVLQLNPNHALPVGGMGLHMTMVGESERGMQLIDRATRLNPHHPPWYHLVPFMVHYSRREFDLAWTFARRFNIPGFYWDPLIRAATLGQLNREAEAGKAVEELVSFVPDFASRGRGLVKRLAFLDENVDMLLDGLRKAGLNTHGS